MRVAATRESDMSALLEGNTSSPGHVCEELNDAQQALNKLRRAHSRGTGTRLTREEVRSLSLTLIGEMWEQDDPRINGERNEPVLPSERQAHEAMR